MKRIQVFVYASFLTLGISAQNFGLSLDYMFLQGTMIKKNEVPYISKNGHQALPYSRVLGINYINAINKKLIASASAGYGFGFQLIPLKTKLSYSITNAIFADLGCGLYIIEDKSYIPNSSTYRGSFNEFGINFGILYQINSIVTKFSYEMIKASETSSLNSFTIGLVYMLPSCKKE